MGVLGVIESALGGAEVGLLVVGLPGRVTVLVGLITAIRILSGPLPNFPVGVVGHLNFGHLVTVTGHFVFSFLGVVVRGWVG